MPDNGSQSSSRARGHMERLEGLLPRVATAMGLERRLREHTAMSLWNAAADPKLAQCSRPLFLDYQGNIVIAAENAAVAQEISLSKSSILRTLSKMARTVGVEIKGIRIDLKQYHSGSQAATDDSVAALPDPSVDELNAVKLDSQQAAWISGLEAQLEGNPLSGKIVTSARKRLQIINWRKQNGYPCCSLCGLPAKRLQEGDKLCFTCLMEKKYPAITPQEGL